MNMKRLIVHTILALGGVGVAVTALAQAPAGSTGECKDGSYSSAPSKRGACASHGGVKDWYENKKAATTESKASSTAPNKPAAKPTEMPTTAAAGGGAGKVWVNTSSKVYHCSTDKWYGKTKKGEYTSEADAKAKGNHADHGKSCS